MRHFYAYHCRYGRGTIDSHGKLYDATLYRFTSAKERDAWVDDDYRRRDPLTRREAEKHFSAGFSGLYVEANWDQWDDEPEHLSFGFI